MKDFDEARRIREAADRSFKIGGKTLTYRPAVSPEAIISWTEFAGATDKEQAALRAAQANLSAAHAALRAVEAADGSPAELASASAEIAAKTADVAVKVAAVEEKTRSEMEWIGVIDETIAAILEPEHAEAWQEIRDPGLPHPLSLGDLQTLMEWLMEQVTGRPTSEASASSPSPEPTETASTAASSSPAEPAPTAST